MSAAYHWRDERDGTWTRLEEAADRVLVRRSPAHARGAFVGLMFMASLAIVIVFRGAGGTGTDLLIGVLIAGVVLYRVPATWRNFRSFRANDLVVEVVDGNLMGASRPECIGSHEIEQIEVRENAGRRGSDAALWQIYVRLHGIQTRKLIYQTYKWRKERIVTIAERLANRWRVPVEVGK